MMDEANKRPAAYLRLMEKIPTGVYMTAALAAIAGAAALRLFGKKDAAIFVGQWPPTFMVLVCKSEQRSLRARQGAAARPGLARHPYGDPRGGLDGVGATHP